MKRNSKKSKLTRLILGALLTSGAAWTSSAVSAQTVTVSDVGAASDRHPSGLRQLGGLPVILGIKTLSGGVLYLTGGSAGDKFFTGAWEGGTVSDNVLHMHGGYVNCIYGAYNSVVNGDAFNNAVNIYSEGPGVKDSAFGAWSANGSAYNNTASIYEGTGNVNKLIGAYGKNGAYNNTANVYGGTVRLAVYGGYTDNQNAVAHDNTVNIYSKSNNKNLDVYGGYAKGEAHSNTVNLFEGATVKTIYGGFSTTGREQIWNNTLNLIGTDINVKGKIQHFQFINFTDVLWNPNTPVLTLTGEGIVQNEIGSKATINAQTLRFANPETIENGATMDLISSANAIIADLSATTAMQEYTVTPVTGLLVNAALQGNLAFNEENTKLTYTASNQASKLTFTDVEWKNSGSLLDHATTLSNISFKGAAVDTSNIRFTSGTYIKGNNKMTLVSNVGGAVGTITGTTYKIGTTLQGQGKASMVGDDLVFTVKMKKSDDTPDDPSDDIPDVEPQEQTHSVLMGAGAGMANLTAGNDFIGAATEGLGLASNTGADGVSCYAGFGGGSFRQKTGSHVDVNMWNAILALGHQNKKERGTMEYGAFFEYGNGNYTAYNGDLRGDGSTRYTGGGLLAKWTAKSGTYVEGSFRAGSLHGETRSVLVDGEGTPYNYDVDVPYMGFHLGVGKEIAFDEMHSLDVYGKYFYNRRNSTSFEAGGQYELDALTSQVLRIGARYTLKRDKWDFYGGLAYEHELDGKATGTADGISIRSTDPSGGSLRAELGATMNPNEKNPWKLDFNLAGFAGKKQGVRGGVSVAWMF